MDKSKNPTGTSPVLGDASNSIADKQLREAILGLKKPDKFLFVQPIEAELQDLIDLFHTYGNRERLDELVTLTPNLVMETECKECVKNEDTINNRIAGLIGRLNRE